MDSEWRLQNPCATDKLCTPPKSFSNSNALASEPTTSEARGRPRANWARGAGQPFAERPRCAPLAHPRARLLVLRRVSAQTTNPVSTAHFARPLQHAKGPGSHHRSTTGAHGARKRTRARGGKYKIGNVYLRRGPFNQVRWEEFGLTDRKAGPEIRPAPQRNVHRGRKARNRRSRLRSRRDGGVTSIGTSITEPHVGLSWKSEKDAVCKSARVKSKLRSRRGRR